MAALFLQHRSLPTGPIVIEWNLDDPEAHCHDTGELIIAGTDRCAPHAGAALSCVFEWRVPPECQHEGIDFEYTAHPRCVLCGRVGIEATDKWLKRTTTMPADDDHSSHLTPDAS